MKTTELKALAQAASKTIQERADMNEVAFRECESDRRAFRNEAGPHVLALIATLESAQDERRALLATEQNLRERVKALEDGLADAAQSLCWLAFGECRNITERPLLTALQVEASARALLEKTT